jgi:N-acetylneuraminic acid mutarotase
MAQQEAHNDVDAYNLQSMKWRKLSSLNTGRHGSQAIVYKNCIYIVAGSGSRGGKPELSSLEKFMLR